MRIEEWSHWRICRPGDRIPGHIDRGQEIILSLYDQQTLESTFLSSSEKKTCCFECKEESRIGDRKSLVGYIVEKNNLCNKNTNSFPAAAER